MQEVPCREADYWHAVQIPSLCLHYIASCSPVVLVATSLAVRGADQEFLCDVIFGRSPAVEVHDWTGDSPATSPAWRDVGVEIQQSLPTRGKSSLELCDGEARGSRVVWACRIWRSGSGPGMEGRVQGTGLHVEAESFREQQAGEASLGHGS